MKSKYIKDTFRQNVMYNIYGKIVLEHFVDADNCIKKIKKYNTDKSNYNEFDRLENELILIHVQIVVFSSMCIEAFLNDYIASCIFDENYFKNFDMLNVLGKFQLIVQFIFKDDSNNNEKCISMLKGLNKERNDLVHSKSKSGSDIVFKSLKELEETNSLKDETEEEMNWDCFYSQQISEEKIKCMSIFNNSKKAVMTIVEMAKYFDSQDKGLNAFFRIFSFVEDKKLAQLQCSEKAIKAFQLLGFDDKLKGSNNEV